MRRRGRRRGIAMGLVAIIITLLFVCAFAALRLMQGAGHQMSYADSHLRALTIAESAIHTLTARMMSKPWEDRWFKDEPDFHGNPIEFCGGNYVYIIHDSPGIKESADIWVRAGYRKLRRIIFYRVKYEDMLFRGLVHPNLDFTTTVEDKANLGLKPISLPGLTDKVNSLLAKKKKTSGLAAEKWHELSDNIQPAAILKQLGAEVPEDLILNQSLSKDDRNTKIHSRPTVPVSAKGETTLHNYDKWALFIWISLQGYGAEHAASIRSFAIREFKKVDTSVKRHKYLEAEQTLKNLLVKIYTDSAKVNFELQQAQKKYQQDLAAINPSLPPEEQRAERSRISSAYQAERREIMSRGLYN